MKDFFSKVLYWICFLLIFMLFYISMQIGVKEEDDDWGPE